MNRSITVITPENVVIAYPLAGVASRFLAMLIDLVCQILLILAVGKFADMLGGLASAISSIFTYVVLLGYALIFEAFWGGRTPGKRLLGLRVVRDGGYPITFLASAIRNLLRLVDFGLLPIGSTALTLFGMPGLAAIFFSPSYKRIGDYAAGTLVILDRPLSPLGETSRAALSPQALEMAPYVQHIDRITPEEYMAVRRFVARRSTFDIVVQAALGERLARPLMEKLEIQPPLRVQLQYADLLEAIERRYAEENRLL